MRRRRMSRSGSKKYFTKNAVRVKSKNYRTGSMRGGIRL